MKNMFLFVLISGASFFGMSGNAQNQKLTTTITIVLSQEEAEKLGDWTDYNLKMHRETSDIDKLYMLSAIRGRNTDQYKAMEKSREELAALSDEVAKYEELCGKDTAFLKRFFNEDCKQVKVLEAQLKEKSIEEEELTSQALSTLDYKAMKARKLAINLFDLEQK